MTVFAAAIMGLVQGLTEFLPVSSSAHLVFADHFLHLRLSEADTVSFAVLVHMGTLMAVLVYFRRDILELLAGAGQLMRRPRAAWRENAGSRLFVWLALGTVPAAVLGVTLQDFFSQAFQNVPGTAVLLLGTAAMLFWISRRRHGGRTLEHTTAKDALLIGLFQALAILPGISRSGATITGGLLRGLDRDAAPRFSFLLSVPIILAGGLFDLKDTLQNGFSVTAPVAAVGFVTASVSGYLAVVLLLGVVRRGRLDRFAYYCVAAGIGMLAYWTLLVPKVTSEVAGFVGQRPIPNAQGELGPLGIGDSLKLRMVVDSGLLPLSDAYILAPEGRIPLHLDAATGKGKLGLSSEVYSIPPHQTVHPAGETREVWVILRNKWGIQNEVRLRLLIVPISSLDAVA
jgi:undecaprenyl-diphosphatase